MLLTIVGIQHWSYVLTPVEVIIRKIWFNMQKDPLNRSVSFVGYSEIAELLIQKGADVNLLGQDGNTALILASFRGNRNVN